MMSRGILYIISAPSGAGKTSLVKQLNAQVANLGVSVSHTTRAMRDGETDGKDYCFVSGDEFKGMIDEGEFLEYAQVFDNYYGTSQQSVEMNLQNGIDTILEIDWQGARQIKHMLPESQSIFILPPSIAVLESRLRSRGQDSEAIIARRMRDAVTEMSHYHEFDYLVVNDDFEQALNELKSILLANRLKQERQHATLADLIPQLMASSGD